MQGGHSYFFFPTFDVYLRIPCPLCANWAIPHPNNGAPPMAAFSYRASSRGASSCTSGRRVASDLVALETAEGRWS